MKLSVLQTLKLFSWARAQHLLRMTGQAVTFDGAVRLIAREAKVTRANAEAVIAGRTVDEAAREKLARWNGLRLRQTHGVPVLERDPDAISPEEAIRRVQSRLALRGAA